MLRSTLAGLLICLVLSSCYQINMTDASARPEYAGLIGKKFRLKEDVWAIGYCIHIPKHAVADEILLVPGPVGFKGREVVSTGILRRGSVIQVVGVEVTTDLVAKAFSKVFGENYTKYKVVESGDSQLPSGVPIEIRPDGSYGLTSSAFEPAP